MSRCRSSSFSARRSQRMSGISTPESRYLTVALQGHVLSALICFEAVFPELSREFVRRGSQLIVNLTNDAWYGNTSAPYQHLTMARWRAIESRRYLLRAANSGISAVIAPSGRIRGANRAFAPGHCGRSLRLPCRRIPSISAIPGICLSCVLSLLSWLYSEVSAEEM